MNAAESFRFAGTDATDDQEVLIRGWMQEDACFGVTVFRAWMLALAGESGAETVLELASEHTGTCTTCCENVLARANSEADPYRRMMYFNFGFSVILEWVRAQGGNYQIRRDGNTLSVRVTCPPGEGPIVALESHTPLKGNGGSRVVVEVADRQLLESGDLVRSEDGQTDEAGGRVLQEIDVRQVQHLQDFTAVGFPPVALWPLLGVGADLVIRCGKEEWVIKEGAHMLSRYRGLVQAHWREPRSMSEGGLSDGEIVEVLARLLLKYDGSSRVNGYLRWVVPRRCQDVVKRASRERSLTFADRDGEDRNWADRKSRDRWKDSRQDQHQDLEDRARDDRVRSVFAQLREKDRRLLVLRLEGKTDGEIGAIIPDSSGVG